MKEIKNDIKTLQSILKVADACVKNNLVADAIDFLTSAEEITKKLIYELNEKKENKTNET